jgi:hypothetical protein
MAIDIPSFGTVVNIVASKTYPVGITVTQFADDADSIAFGALKIANTEMGANGDLLRYSKPTPIPVTLNVIPSSIDDENLSELIDANRVGKGKIGASDQITMTVIYPDGSRVTLTGGAITDGEVGKTATSAGRLKTKSYSFMFEQKI